MAGNFDSEALRNAREYAKIQSEINSGLEGYIEGIKNLSKLKKDLQTVDKNIAELNDKISSLANATTQEDLKRKKILEKTLEILEKERSVLEQTRKTTEEIVKNAEKWKMTSTAAVAGVLKGSAKLLGNLDKLPNKISGVFNQFKDLFEMDKAIRKAGLEMGLIGKQSENFRGNIKLAAEDTQKLGMGIKELAEMQAQYSENIGRNVSLGKEGLVALSQIAQGTSLGSEATAQMAADFEAQGVSAIRVKDAIEESANRASSMGLNSAKVVKNIAQNTKMLNKFRFKDGIKGLVKMSELSAKLGVDMEFASGFAEKLWNVEGAVETAAQFNVMGGAFARLGDPFKLMYMARNDIAGLTEELAKAASESATFNKETGKFELGAMEMHRLKIIAEQTGLEYDKLVTAGQNAAKFAKIKTQVSFRMNDEAKQFLENQAQLDENGRAYIEVKGEKKFLSKLGASGAKLIEDQVKEKKSLEERAMAAKSFDEQMVNLINMVKTYMLPIVEGITDVLKPFAEDLMGEKGDSFKKELKALGETLGGWAKTAATWFKSLGEIAVALGPKGILASFVIGKGLSFLLDKAKWFSNGLSLSKGFLMGTKGFSGGSTPTMGSNVGRNSSWSPGQVGRNTGRGASAASRFGSTALRNVGAGIGAGLGGAVGTMGGTAIGGGGTGAMIGSGIGTAIGAASQLLGIPLPIGMALGGMAGGYIGGLFDEPQNDVKFPKLGPNHSKGRMLTQNGKITPIDNKDELLAMKPGGVVDKTLNNTNAGVSATKIEFGELNITGEIKVNLPGGTQIGLELLKSTEFKSAITRTVQSQLEKNINGKNSDRK